MEPSGQASSGRLLLGGTGILLAAAAPVLLGYSSVHASVLGRYSPSYAALLAFELSLSLACIALAVVPGPAAGKTRDAIAGATRSTLRSGWALALALVLQWSVVVALAFGLAHVELGKSLALHLVGVATVLWVSFGTILLARIDARSRARALAKYILLLIIGASAVILCEAFLRKSPGHIPARVLFEMPGGGEFLGSTYVADSEITVGYRYKPGITVSDRMMASQANLFIQQPDLLRPVAPADDRVLLEASFRTDENGYRNASPLLERYAVAVSGDSFTSLSIEPRPWPAILAEKLSKPVLNLGLQGYGPQSESQALIRFGLPRKPDWLVVAYFEGNDLIDAQNYESKRRSGLGWVEADYAEAGLLERFATFHVLRFAFRRAFKGRIDKPALPESAGDYPYPFVASIAGRDVPLSFSTTYISRLDLSRKQVESLIGFQATIASLRRLDQAAREAHAKLVVAYLPAKEHCYAPLLPAALLEKKLGGAKRVATEDGKLATSVLDRKDVTAPELLSHVDGQRAALTESLKAAGIEVLDLTPAFQEAASRGEQLYLVNDTHWSAAGHDLAATVLAKRLARGD